MKVKLVELRLERASVATVHLYTVRHGTKMMLIWIRLLNIISLSLGLNSVRWCQTRLIKKDYFS